MIATRRHNRCLMCNRRISSSRHHLWRLLELNHVHGSFVFVYARVVAAIWRLFFHNLAVVLQSNLSYRLLIKLLVEALIEGVVSGEIADDLITFLLSNQVWWHLSGSWREAKVLLPFLFFDNHYRLLLLVSLTHVSLIHIHLLNIMEQRHFSGFFFDYKKAWLDQLFSTYVVYLYQIANVPFFDSDKRGRAIVGLKCHVFKWETLARRDIAAIPRRSDLARVDWVLAGNLFFFLQVCYHLH